MLVVLEQWWMSGQWEGAPVVETPAVIPSTAGARFDDYIELGVRPIVDYDEEAAVTAALLMLRVL